MTDERVQFLAERQTMIGGSDIGPVLWEGDYGCRRRAWYDKTGVEQDYPMLEHEGPIARGRILEPIAADEWLRGEPRKGPNGEDPWPERKLRHRAVRVHPDIPYFGCHIDYEILNDPRGVGLLSIKVPGERMFRKFGREGLDPAYLLQLQWELGVTGRTWGGYWIFHADGWRGLYFEVARDDVLIAGIQAEAHSFWRQVENGPAPDPLPAEDSRCLRCPWVKTCQGNELFTGDLILDGKHELEVDDSLDAIVRDYLDQHARREDAKVVFNLIADSLREHIGARQRLLVNGTKVYYAQQKGREELDLKELKLKEPGLYADLLARFKKTITGNRPLKVYGPKGEGGE